MTTQQIFVGTVVEVTIPEWFTFVSRLVTVLASSATNVARNRKCV
jgi:hypothetical protein